jgi:hypothetical protein
MSFDVMVFHLIIFLFLSAVTIAMTRDFWRYCFLFSTVFLFAFIAYDPLDLFLKRFGLSADVEKFIHLIVLLIFSSIVIRFSIMAFELIKNKLKSKTNKGKHSALN